ncbi:phage holin family protein [Capnocytophaga canis]|uniref:Holin n=1 Tax=Capnocytophaga canis TaxID=1848903 RepID=A0A0B7ITU2_9FLAO|nr:phage holin family protein [Capnocytophaga canis]CEN53373.1 hypothetical protein CCAND93_410003 [Capnocytophaga canis]
MIDFLQEIGRKYGFFVIGGAIGAVVHRLRHKMSWKRFLISIAISAFVSMCVGVICLHYFKLEEPIIHVLCGISGVFSETILDELEDIIKSSSEYVKKKMGVENQPKTDD